MEKVQPLEGKRRIYVNFSVNDVIDGDGDESDSSLFNAFNNTVLTEEDTKSPQNFCDDHRTLEEQLSGDQVGCKRNFSHYCGGTVKVSLKYIEGISYYTPPDEEPFDAYGRRKLSLSVNGKTVTENGNPNGNPVVAVFSGSTLINVRDGKKIDMVLTQRSVSIDQYVPCYLILKAW
jgi:hypothetical protein